MNAEQKKFFHEVIKPVIIDMAVDGSLPMDMNELHWDYFEKKANEFNNSPEQVREKELERLGEYVSEHERTTEEQLEALEEADDSDQIGDVIDLCEMHEDLAMIDVNHFYKDYL